MAHVSKYKPILSTADNSFIKIQLNNVDSYQFPPGKLDIDSYEDLRGVFRLPQVPVVRIFGTTDKGVNATVHVHGVFPYFYIEYEGDLNQDKGE
jgi:DNA polymerase zeta